MLQPQESFHLLETQYPDLAGEIGRVINANTNDNAAAEIARLAERYSIANGDGIREFNADRVGDFFTDRKFWREFAIASEARQAGFSGRMLEFFDRIITLFKRQFRKLGSTGAGKYLNNLEQVRKDIAGVFAEAKRRNKGMITPYHRGGEIVPYRRSGMQERSQRGRTKPVTGARGSNSVQSVPVSEINVDPARFQFKSRADKTTGVDNSNQLGGNFDPKTAGNLYLWEDKNGKKFVVNGHHRLALAKENNVETVNAIVDREADGISAGEARRNGVLINIRDEQGDVADYADFVRSENMDEVTAGKEGILAREKGRNGYIIGKYATDNLFSAFKTGDISAAKAAVIADISRGDEGLEALGISQAKKMSQLELREFLKLAKTLPRTQSGDSGQGDLFGFDDSAIQENMKISRLAVRHIRDVEEKVSAAKNAIKNPKAAEKLGVKVKKDARKLLDNALKEQLRWEQWATDPELYAQLRREAGLDNKNDTTENVAETPAQKTAVSEEENGRFNPDSETPLLTPEEDSNDFQLISETAEEAEIREQRAKQEERKRAEKAKHLSLGSVRRLHQ